MLDLDTQFADPIASEYARYSLAIGEEDPYKTQDCVGIHDVLHAHFLIADFFYKEGEGLGGIGPKSIDLLHSALYRQHIAYDGKARWGDFFEKVATLFFGIIRDHPFHDANKRTALLTALYHLSLRSYQPVVDGLVLENFAVEVAEGAYVHRRRYRQLNKKDYDAEVKFIAKWFRQNTRKVVKSEYIVTYRELNTLLSQYGFELGNSHRNFIDVNRVKVRRKLLTREVYEVRERVGRIGFPGMTRQVSKGDLRKVREMTDLTHQRGYDSEVFYRGLSDLGALIANYQDALRRLADR